MLNAHEIINFTADPAPECTGVRWDAREQFCYFECQNWHCSSINVHTTDICLLVYFSECQRLPLACDVSSSTRESINAGRIDLIPGDNWALLHDKGAKCFVAKVPQAIVISSIPSRLIGSSPQRAIFSGNSPLMLNLAHALVDSNRRPVKASQIFNDSILSAIWLLLSHMLQPATLSFHRIE